ncbi:ABC transporter permease [Aeromicrobium phragmitis]|uniref:ABC transporter permease n=1 Tax=Aeromicrobium phragmitis TaxID=2478914 RepID=A0A3L8PJC4_9ACTN|nr:ABC transporter permease [Aeromicrobium phragmitis]RLV54783.1 ABC transporter permease [Aeromicrobium phragmitis]
MPRSSTWSMVWLVAMREVRTRVLSKVFVLTSGLFVLAIVGGGAFFAFFGPDSQDASRLGVTSDAAALEPALMTVAQASGTDVEIERVEDDAVEEKIRDGGLDAVLSGSLPDVEVTVESDLDSALQTVIVAVVQQEALAGEIAELGGDPAAVAQQVAEAEPQIASLDDEEERDPAQMIAGFVSGILIFIALMGGGQRVAQGVVEEKSSRVVELLLATMRPWQLMAGKVLGNVIVGLLEIGVIVVAALATAWGFDLLDASALNLGSVAVWMLVWFLVGFVMYALLLASLAALVSRQEDVGSVISPVIGIMMVPYIVGVSIAPWNPESPIVEVLSYIPFCSPFIMPIRVALGTAGTGDVFIALALSVVLIPALVWLSGRIYSNAILRTGARVSLRQALRRS